MLRLPDFTIDNPDDGIGQPIEWWRRLVEAKTRGSFSGVYLYYSPTKEVLYVGRATDVAARLKHHFNKDQFLTLFSDGNGRQPGWGINTRRWTYQNEFPNKGTRIAVWKTDSQGRVQAAKNLEGDLIQAHVLALGHGPRHNRTIPQLTGHQISRPSGEALRDARFLEDTILPYLP